MTLALHLFSYSSTI